MTDNSGGGSAALIHLSCFGGFRVTAERPLGAPFLRPGGVAMLAILAARGEVGISNEELRALAWGELSEAEGRTALANAVTALWRGGNGDSLLATGDRIAFHPDRVTTDVGRFVAACDRADVTAASAIYEGPYFGGVTIDAGVAFNEWLDATRDRFNTQYQEVAREARRAARKTADPAVPDWTAPIALGALPTPTIEPAAELAPEVPVSARVNFWVGGAVVICVALALWISQRSRDGANGAAALNRGDFVVARAALNRAIASDSSDGWLWFQLARAADGEGDNAAADQAAIRADSLREPLAGDRAALVHGYRQWRSGNTLRAVALLDSLVQQQPGFVEATAVLGEVRYRSSPLIGQSRQSAKASLERAVALDPSAGGSWRRLLAIALVSHDTALGDNALTGLRAAMGPRADTTSAAKVLERSQLLGVDAGRTTEALVLLEPLLADRNTLADRTSARVIRAALFGAVADWTRVDSEAVQLGRVWPWGGLMLEAAAMLSPTRSVRPAELRDLRDRLTRTATDSNAVFVRHPWLPGASRTLRLYLLGEIAYRMGDARGLQAAVDSLSSPKLGELDLPRTGGSYALSLQALQFLARGDSASALGRVEQASGPVPLADQAQLWVNGSLERRRRAVLLETAGRPGEAAGWNAGSGEPLVDLLLGPPRR